MSEKSEYYREKIAHDVAEGEEIQAKLDDGRFVKCPCGELICIDTDNYKTIDGLTYCEQCVYEIPPEENYDYE